MDDIVCRTNGAGETIAFRRHHGIAGTNHREVCVPGGFGEMPVNRFDCEGAGDLAGVPAAHAVTHDIESERGVGYKAILVVRPFEAGIGFRAMQSFEGQKTPPSSREIL